MMRHKFNNALLVAGVAFYAATNVLLTASAQESESSQSAAPAGDSDGADLAKKLSNPVASLISVPFQFNYDGNLGPGDDGDKYTLNIQPVIPISISQDWNMISRTILPITYQSDVVPGDDEFGLGDIVQSLFLSPKDAGKGGIIWGVGPVALLPTATDEQLGGEKFGLGPTAVVLKQSGGFTYGALVNHIWSVAGDDDRADVSSTFMQPFLAYTTPSAWTFSLNSETTYDWKGDNWSVPFNLAASKLFHIGKQPVSLQGGLRYWAESPSGGPEGFGGRVTFTLLFPKK